MKLLRNYELRGLGVERMLERLRQEGIVLYNVRRMDAHTLRFSCAHHQAKQTEALITSLGFSLRALAPSGASRILCRLRKACTLWLLALCALFALSLSLRFVWRISIVHAGIYAGEVRTFLKEEGISPGILKSRVDTTRLSDRLLSRLPDIAWVRVRFSGQTLRIEITQGVPMPPLESEGKAGDIVAACDGVIDRIDVFAGTAAVRPGDTVRAGEVLIRGTERGKNGSPVAIRARGLVTARVWKSAAVELPAAEYISTPTGRSAYRIVIASPWLRFCDAASPDFLTADFDKHAVTIGGAWLPFWLERETYTEVSLEEKPRDVTLLQSEAGALAMQKLLLQCGGSHEMIDKWLDYSMIEGENILATATAELLVDIGRFLPESSD